ncbi:hypothetical protein, partial [Xenorhabdus hominickii]|uniref:hypothetical protein n=1 Tax=Xenorhabdus hominickii TaxID=351679 RepID=UPI001B7FF6F2
FVTITAIDVSFGHALPLKGGKHITTTNYLIHDPVIRSATRYWILAAYNARNGSLNPTPSATVHRVLCWLRSIAAMNAMNGSIRNGFSSRTVVTALPPPVLLRGLWFRRVRRHSGRGVWIPGLPQVMLTVPIGLTLRAGCMSGR